MSKNEENAEKSFIALIGGTLIDGTGSDPILNTTILIEADKIVKVGSASDVLIPENAKKFDISGKFVLPGFIDAHEHLSLFSEIFFPVYINNEMSERFILLSKVSG